MPRLALCHCCHTITRLPDPPKTAPLVPARWEWVDEDGKTQEHWFRDEAGQQVLVPKWDPSLEDWTARHEHLDVPETVKKHDLWSIDQLSWDATDVVMHLQQSMREATGNAYAERDELKDEAMKCFEAHHRPSDACPDVFSEAKQLGGHESNKHMPPNDRLYLCHLCPFVHGYVIPEVRRRKERRQHRVRRR
jgi:hypothetical protein